MKYLKWQYQAIYPQKKVVIFAYGGEVCKAVFASIFDDTNIPVSRVTQSYENKRGESR